MWGQRAQEEPHLFSGIFFGGGFKIMNFSRNVRLGGVNFRPPPVGVSRPKRNLICLADFFLKGGGEIMNFSRNVRLGKD